MTYRLELFKGNGHQDVNTYWKHTMARTWCLILQNLPVNAAGRLINDRIESTLGTDTDHVRREACNMSAESLPRIYLKQLTSAFCLLTVRYTKSRCTEYKSPGFGTQSHTFPQFGLVNAHILNGAAQHQLPISKTLGNEFSASNINVHVSWSIC